MVDTALVEDTGEAHREMQEGLLRTLLLVSMLSFAALTASVLLDGGPIKSAVAATLMGGILWFWSQREGAPMRALGIALCFSTVVLIIRGALDLGGAAGSALSFSFLPGLVAFLVLGRFWGVCITVLMLAGNGWLLATTPLPTLFDRLRFQDQILMILFASGLGYSLSHSLSAYQAWITKHRLALLDADTKRKGLAATVFDELEPLTGKLVAQLALEPGSPGRASLTSTLVKMKESLEASRALAGRGPPTIAHGGDRDIALRIKVMRTWFRIGAVFMSLIILRNVLANQAFVPSLFALAFCVTLDIWLGRRKRAYSLEVFALLIGVLATMSLFAHILEYGGKPDAPALVIIPSIVLFSALLSRGPAVWVVVALQLGILVWVGFGQDLPIRQSRLLGDLAIGSVVVATIVRSVLRLRNRFAATLREQTGALVERQRRLRRLSGTLFHDVNNHLQVLMLQVELEDDPEMEEHCRSLSRRIANLIALSKEFLLEAYSRRPLEMVPVTMQEAADLLKEAYGPRLSKKEIRLVVGEGNTLSVRANPVLLAESVLGNLVGNAIKFSPSGSQVGLSAKRDGDFIRIAVEDRGCGVPREVIEQLESDVAAPSSLGTAGEEGQGYGLQLVSEHLKRMGGHLELKTTAQGGTEAIAWLVADAPLT